MGKKLLSMVLALVMALGMAVCGGAEDAKPKGERTEGVQEELYTLWGIPWGSTEEVVRQVVREKTGLELECKEYPKHLTLSTPIFKEMQLYGIPVHSLALGLDENGFQYAQMTLSSYRYNSKNALVQDTAAFLENIGGILYQRIGFPLNGSLLVGKETKFYKFPFTAQGRFDIPLMNQILDENDSVTMYITWSNVKLEVGTYYINGKHYTSNSLWFDNEPIEFVRRDDLPPYPKKQFDECIYIEL